MPSLIDFVDKKKGSRLDNDKAQYIHKSDNSQQVYNDDDDVDEGESYHNPVTDIVQFRQEDNDYNNEAYDDFDENYSFCTLSQATAILDQSNIELQEIYSQLIWSRQEYHKIALTMVEKQNQFSEVKDTLEFRVKELELEVERDELMRQLEYMNTFHKIPTTAAVGSKSGIENDISTSAVVIIDTNKSNSVIKHESVPAVSSPPLIELKDLFPKPKQKKEKEVKVLVNDTNPSVVNAVDSIINNNNNNNNTSSSSITNATSTTTESPLTLPPGFISPFFSNNNNNNNNNNSPYGNKGNVNNNGSFGNTSTSLINNGKIENITNSSFSNNHVYNYSVSPFVSEQNFVTTTAKHITANSSSTLVMNEMQQQVQGVFLIQLQQFNQLQSALLQQLASLQSTSSTLSHTAMLQPVEQQVNSIVNNITAMVSAMESAGTFITLPLLHTAGNDDSKYKYSNDNKSFDDVTDDRYQVERAMENMLSIVVDRCESRLYQQQAEAGSKALSSLLLQKQQQYSSNSGGGNNSSNYNSARMRTRMSARSMTRKNSNSSSSSDINRHRHSVKPLSLRPFAEAVTAAIRLRPSPSFCLIEGNPAASSYNDDYDNKNNNNNNTSIGIKLLYHGLWSLRRSRSINNNSNNNNSSNSNNNNNNNKTMVSSKSASTVPVPLTFYAPQPTATTHLPLSRQINSTVTTTTMATSASIAKQTTRLDDFKIITNDGRETKAVATTTTAADVATNTDGVVVDDSDWRRLVDEAYRSISLSRINNSSGSSSSCSGGGSKHRRHRSGNKLTSPTAAAVTSSPSSSLLFVQHPPSQPKPSQIDSRPATTRRRIVTTTNVTNISTDAAAVDMKTPTSPSSSSSPLSSSSSNNDNPHHHHHRRQQYNSSVIIKSPLRYGEFDTRLSGSNQVLLQQQHEDYIYNNLRASIGEDTNYNINNNNNDNSSNSPDLHSWRIAHPRRLPLTEPPATLKYARFKNKYSSRTRASLRPAGVGQLPRGFRSVRVQDSGLEQLYHRVLHTQQEQQQAQQGLLSSGDGAADYDGPSPTATAVSATTYQHYNENPPIDCKEVEVTKDDERRLLVELREQHQQQQIMLKNNNNRDQQLDFVLNKITY